jgi:hypothetical protein
MGRSLSRGGAAVELPTENFDPNVSNIRLGLSLYERSCVCGTYFLCGYFLDGDILDDILHFRNDTLDT